jgi:hypothetical protein
MTKETATVGYVGSASIYRVGAGEYVAAARKCALHARADNADGAELGPYTVRRVTELSRKSRDQSETAQVRGRAAERRIMRDKQAW